MTVAGAFVEVGDGLTPYGFSAQDLTADALGASAEAFIKRTGTRMISSAFGIGKVAGHHDSGSAIVG